VSAAGVYLIPAVPLEGLPEAPSRSESLERKGNVKSEGKRKMSRAIGGISLRSQLAMTEERIKYWLRMIQDCMLSDAGAVHVRNDYHRMTHAHERVKHWLSVKTLLITIILEGGTE